MRKFHPLALPLAAILSAWTQAPVAMAQLAPNASIFGPNVLLFDPSMDAAKIQSLCNATFTKQERSQFGPARYAILFKPGAYKVDVNVGFYTQVCGLGKLPGDVTINGDVHADGNWMPAHNVTQNFWRACENLTIAPAKGDTSKWAVSQAAPMRRVHIKGNLALSESGWASGGFLADSLIDGRVASGSQQQWFSRNNTWGSWTGGNWNMFFLGCTPPPAGTWPERPYTVVEKTPLIREKPFLFADAAGKYAVFVPALRRDSVGCSWQPAPPEGEVIPIEKFHIAQAAKDTAATMNAALAAGKNLLLTPGIYHLKDSIRVMRPGTVVLGLGLATLLPDTGAPAMLVSDVDGVSLAGILFDAGPKESPALLVVGEPGSAKDHSKNPTFLYDIFCRLGGATAGSATVSMILNSSSVVGDHFWIWRADHGQGVGWTVNKGKNGLIVNGRGVTLYGLFVEHYQEDQVQWNGDGGRTYFFQSEMPYDPPGNTVWKHGAIKGWPGYKVADKVNTHEAWGLGVYCVFQKNVLSENAIEAPDKPGVKFHNALSYRLGGKGEGISNVINKTGGEARPKAQVIEYPPAK